MTTSNLDFEARNIQWLEFELSNQCHYTNAHEWCPRHCLGNAPKVRLPTSAIERTVEFFTHYDFSGSVYFSIYNEPLMDERIFDLIRYVKGKLPKCLVQMFTNGVELNDETATKLAEAGLGILWISVYPEQQGRDFGPLVEKMKALGLHAVPVNRFNCISYSGYGYDERVGIYGRNVGNRTPCYMPIQYFLVTCNGDVMLCWDDWKATVTFGNVVSDDIASILTNPQRLEKIAALKLGHRDGVCVGCGRPTELCIMEYRDRLKL